MASASPLRDRFADLTVELQESICAGLEEVDGGARFGRDEWRRPGGGGGVTRVLAEGAVFEKAGVNVSRVHGALDPELARRLGPEPGEFWAAGLSLILHPRSPLVPTVHLNLRRLEAGGDAWFGGGADLTPCYLEEEDARHFHRVLAAACDRHPVASYERFKRECDEYFQVRHRGEARGVGGVFFDDLSVSPEAVFDFVADLGRCFLSAYLPIVARRRDLPYGERERRWQRLRRGRYVEFNLVHDRGTRFGLDTGGRIESVLVSMPPVAAWEYGHEPEPGSPEAALVAVLRSPREWR